MDEREPVKLAAAVVVGVDGPMVAVVVGELVLCLAREDAERWGRALMREAAKAEGFTLMAAGMEICSLSKRTRDRALRWAVHHTVGDKQ